MKDVEGARRILSALISEIDDFLGDGKVDHERKTD